jgi:hypothetical protein
VTVAAAGWLVTVPFAGLELIGGGFGWAPVAFIPIAVLTAAAWWLHLRERDQQIGAGGATAGWLFIGCTVILGIAAFFWVMVAAAVLVSATAYGIVLVVTRRRARRPGLELLTGLSLIAAGSVPVVFTLIAGIGNTDAWWMPAHVMFAVGIPLATALSALPTRP